jgi:hypothetical protein
VEFSVTASSGESVNVHCDNWMLAMGKAMAFFADAPEVGKWICTPGKQGTIKIEDVANQRTFVVKPVEMIVKIVAKGPQREAVPLDEVGPARSRRTETPLAEDLAPPPMLQMPTKSRLAPKPLSAEQVAAGKRQEKLDQLRGEAFAERLWDLTTDLPMLDPDQACQRTLQLVLDIVPCEAASVARGASHDFQMKIAAAHGPVADKIMNQPVPFGEGLMGLCYESRMSIHVADAQSDNRHNRVYDAEFSFTTREVLCVPVVTPDEVTYGVLQLINPTDPFLPEEIVVVEQIARALATSLSTSLE